MLGGITSESLAKDENPVYQPAEPPQYELVVGVTSSDAQMKENPAYEAVYRHNCIPAERGAWVFVVVMLMLYVEVFKLICVNFHLVCGAHTYFSMVSA